MGVRSLKESDIDRLVTTTIPILEEVTTKK